LWHWWHGCSYDTGFPEYLPPREGEKSFQSALAAAHKHDVHALVYMNQRLWGMTTRSWTNEGAERFAVKDAAGRIHPEVYNTFTMPPYDDLWPAEFAPKEPLKLLDRKFSRQFYLEQARAFVWGQQPTVANFLPAHLQERPEETEFATRLARIRSRTAKYLLRGTFLRPPQLDAPEATLDFSRLSIYAGQQGGLTTFQKRLPLALAGAWRAPDGKVAVALTSIANEPLALSLNLDAVEYGLPKRGRVYRIDERGRKRIGEFSGPRASLELTLPPRGAQVVEFQRR
jgi:hypothetical protein